MPVNNRRRIIPADKRRSAKDFHFKYLQEQFRKIARMDNLSPRQQESTDTRTKMIVRAGIKAQRKMISGGILNLDGTFKDFYPSKKLTKLSQWFTKNYC